MPAKVAPNLSFRDAIGTVLVAVAVAATLSIVYAWNWPFLQDARAGAIALFVLSYPSCLIAQAPQRMARSIQHGEPWSPFVVGASALGALALLLILANLVLNSVAILVTATALVIAIWLVSTLHHAAEPRPQVA